jgi:hypothetical protein
LLSMAAVMVVPTRALATSCSSDTFITDACPEINTTSITNDIHIQPTGSVTGPTGVLNETQFVASLTNEGLISGTLTAGILNDDGGFDLIDNEGGFIFGAVTGFENTTLSFLGTLTNSDSGTISGDEYGITNNTSTIGLISNLDALIHGGDSGIYNDTDTIGTLSNSGSIVGAEDVGISNAFGGTIAQLTNAAGGAITGGEVGVRNLGILNTLSNAGGITGSAESGIYNRGSIALLSNSGSVGGANFGVYNSGGMIDLLSNSGTISGTAIAGVENNDCFMCDVTILGTIVQLTNAVGGVITGGDFGVENFDTMNTLVNNGLISGTTLDGVLNSGSIGLLSNSGGTIIGGDTGIDNENMLLTLSNSGNITGTAKVGILNGSEGTIALLNNTIGGVISGHSTGVFNQGLIATLANSGSIVGNVSTGVDNRGSISVLSNSGVIRGGSSGVYNAGGTIGLLSNSGTITGTSTAGIENVDNLFDDVDSLGTIFQITNSGTGVIIGGGFGILNRDTIDTIVNNGLISGNTLDGVLNSGSISLLSNSGGTIIGGDTGIDNRNMLLTLSNSGSIGGANLGAYNDGGTIDLLSNSGTISGTAIAGIENNEYFIMCEVTILGTIVQLTNAPGGVISGGEFGVENFDTMNTVVNNGLISGATNGVANAGLINTLNNSGTIIATATIHGGADGVAVAGIRNDPGGMIGVLNNAEGGYITGGSSGIYNLGSITLLTNSGSISGGSSGIDNEGGISTLSNSGMIHGGSSGIDNAGAASASSPIAVPSSALQAPEFTIATIARTPDCSAPLGN